jgi:hypothetical protein
MNPKPQQKLNAPQSVFCFALFFPGEIGEVRHVNCFMGSPLASLFNDPNAGVWVREHKVSICCPLFLNQKRLFYQDRLGTNMRRRETQKKTGVLFEQVKPTGSAVRKRHSFESVSLYSSD